MAQEVFVAAQVFLQEDLSEQQAAAAAATTRAPHKKSRRTREDRKNPSGTIEGPKRRRRSDESEPFGRRATTEKIAA